MRVCYNRLVWFARSVSKDNLVQIADYLAKSIKRDFRSGLHSQSKTF